MIPSGRQHALAGAAKPMGQVKRVEVQESAGIAVLRADLDVGLWRYHQQHAEHQRHQQAQAARSGEAPAAPFNASKPNRNSGNHEQKRHPPAVERDHWVLQPFGLVAAFDVEVPAGHIDHRRVVQDQQAEGNDAQGVDIVTALHAVDSASQKVASIGTHARSGYPEVTVRRGFGTNRGTR